MANSSPSPSKPLVKQVDWYAIASKIRIQNDKLKEQINELETVIEEQKQQIKVQVIKNQDYSYLEENQQEKLKQLELEITEKEEQITNQKLTINNLTKELEKIQQQTARLERECSLLQDGYNEQKYQLNQLEKENKELKIRLQRQQRYNIQYKTALDQVISASSGDTNINSVIQSFSENNLPPSFSANKEVLNPEKLEENITDNQQKVSINQENEILENNQEITEISSEKNGIGNVNFLNSMPNKSDNQNNITQTSHIIKTETKEEISETENQKHQEEKKPKRRMFIQLPQFGKKRED